MPSELPQRVGPLLIGVFLDEIALLAVLGIAGARLGGSAVAPRAQHRLGRPLRLAAKLALIAVASALLAAAGPIWWATAFLVLSAALVTAGELGENGVSGRGSA